MLASSITKITFKALVLRCKSKGTLTQLGAKDGSKTGSRTAKSAKQKPQSRFVCWDPPGPPNNDTPDLDFGLLWHQLGKVLDSILEGPLSCFAPTS